MPAVADVTAAKSIEENTSAAKHLVQAMVTPL